MATGSTDRITRIVSGKVISLPAYKKQGGKWIKAHDRLAIYMRDQHKCCYCDRDLTQLPSYAVTLDHITPRSQGGTDHPSNLVSACTYCNSARQDRTLDQFVQCKDRASYIMVQLAKPLNTDQAKQLIKQRKQKVG